MKEEHRFFAAIAISFLILFGWGALFPPPEAKKPVQAARSADTDANVARTATPPSLGETIPPEPISVLVVAAPETSLPEPDGVLETVAIDRQDSAARWTVSTTGGVLTRFDLLRYPRGHRDRPDRVELVGAHFGDTPTAQPFSLATRIDDRELSRLAMAELPSDSNSVALVGAPRSAGLPPGIVIEKRFERTGEDRLRFTIRFRNPTNIPLSLGSARLEDPHAGTSRTGAVLLHLGPDLGKNLAESIYANDYIPTPVVGRPAMEIPTLGEPGWWEGLMGFIGRKRAPTTDLDWAGIQTHHFALAIRSASNEKFDALYNQENGRLHLWILVPAASVDPGAAVEHSYDVFLGAKETDRLLSFHASLEPLDGMEPKIFPHEISFARWLVQLLQIIHRLTGNYGWAIILLTLAVKGALWPLSHLSFKSMAKMQALRPEMEKIQRDFKNDKERLQRETMRLYQEAGVNPLGGCLPMVIQMPILVGLFYALQSAVVIRREPFLLWVHDLSVADTVGHVFGLPINPIAIVMVALMFVQQRMTPTPDTPEAQEQKQVMSIMLLFMAFLFYSAPSGLTIYWTLQSILSILQQSYLMKGATPPNGIKK